MKTKEVEVPKLLRKQIVVSITSLSPLLTDNPAKMIDNILNPGPRIKKKRNVNKEYKESLYYFDDKIRTGFPAVGFKSAIIRGVDAISGLTMVSAQGAIFVIADDPVTGLVEIKGEHASYCKAITTRNTGGQVIVRGVYYHWTANLSIDFDPATITYEQLLFAINKAGYSCGVGSMRPGKNKSGTYGRWELVK